MTINSRNLHCKYTVHSTRVLGVPTMPLNPLLVIKASMTTCILHKKYWISIFGAYAGSLMQSKLQFTISSPKQRVSKHCKIHQVQNQSSAPRHWASGCESCSAPGTDSRVGNNTFLLQLLQVNHLQVLDRKCQLSHTRIIWTYLQSSCYIAIFRQLRTQLRSNKVSTLTLFLKTLLWAAASAAASKYANTATAGKTAVWPRKMEWCTEPSSPKGLMRFLLYSNSALVCAKNWPCACSFHKPAVALCLARQNGRNCPELPRIWR